MTLPIKKYLLNNVMITIAILAIGVIVFMMMPRLSIIQLIADFQAYSTNNTSIEAINNLLLDLEAKQHEFENFIVLIKFLVSVTLTLILFLLSFFYYTQNEFQQEIQELKLASTNNFENFTNKTTTKIDEVEVRIHGIDKTLEMHFGDYAELMKYNHFNENKIIHHDFKEALTYDIDKINKLNIDETYKSTVILTNTYLDAINTNELLKEYINTLKSKAESKVKIVRIFITRNHELSVDENEHLEILKLSGIDIRLIAYTDVIEIKNTLYRRNDLSDNFIIINDKEVAFSYPHDGFRFAVNLIDNGQNTEVVAKCKAYSDFFNSLIERSKEWQKK